MEWWSPDVYPGIIILSVYGYKCIYKTGSVKIQIFLPCAMTQLTLLCCFNFFLTAHIQTDSPWGSIDVAVEYVAAWRTKADTGLL